MLVDDSLRKKLIIKLIFRRIFSRDIPVFKFAVLSIRTAITGWGGESWTKTVFSLYRPLHLIEAYVWPEKYGLVWAGPLANHPFNFNLIFLSDGATAAAERAACFADLYRR